MLAAILAFNYVDGLAMGLVLQDIKADLHLSDTQLGFLTGIAFALFYSVMGIPIARWADRGNRVAIISVTALLWSVMVILCGRAMSFAQLLAGRVGVAVGEAGCVPPAHSLIADYFSRAERPRAVALYMMGGSLSMAIGYFLAGWLNQLYGWRATFALLGLPGLGLALLAWLTLREPRSFRQIEPSASAAPDLDTTTLTGVYRALWANSSFRDVLFCFCVMTFFSAGIQQWQPAFFIRSYGVGTGELGTWFALIYGVSGILGTYAGGSLASRRAPNNERLQLGVMAAVYAALSCLTAGIYLVPERNAAFGLIAVGTIAAAAVSGPLFAMIQTLVAPRMRATSIALVYLFSNLVGTGLGPLTVGVLSDALRPFLGEESLRYALLALCPGYLWGGWHLWRARRTIVRDLEDTCRSTCPR